MIQLKVLPRTQKKLLNEIAAFASERGFYLGGGTAVALHLGHRISVDFDWFTSTAIQEPLLLAKELSLTLPKFRVVGMDRGTLHGSCHDVKFSFLEYRYKLLMQPIPIKIPEFQMASLEDLLCMKLGAIAQRGTKKDFVDLYFLVKTMKVKRVAALNIFCKKYNLKDASPVIYGLSWFDDAEKDVMPKMLKPVTWSQIKKYISGW